MKKLSILFLVLSFMFDLFICFKFVNGLPEVRLKNVVIDTFTLRNYYQHETKTLDLSNLPVGDEGLKLIFEHVKHFTARAEVKNLILENLELEAIPYYIITFVLTDKNARYLSLKNNRFNINSTDNPDNEIRLTVSELHRYTGMRKYSDPAVLKQELEMSHPEGSPAAIEYISKVISSLWEQIFPGINEAIEQVNTQSDRTCFFSKIIEIDDKIPPVTIIDSTKLPRTRLQIAKSIGKKSLLILLGAVVSLSPQIIAFILDSHTQDYDCEELMELCNITSI